MELRLAIQLAASVVLKSDELEDLAKTINKTIV